MRLLNSSLYNIPALNNKSINNVSFEASATWPATVSGIWNEYIYIWKWGTGKETSISWKFSSKKILRSSRKNFWGKKRNKFQMQRSNHFHRSSVFLFYIQWMNYRKEESNIREPSTIGSLNLNEDIANITFTIYIQLYSKERWNISSTYLERQQ